MCRRGGKARTHRCWTSSFARHFLKVLVSGEVEPLRRDGFGSCRLVAGSVEDPRTLVAESSSESDGFLPSGSSSCSSLSYATLHYSSLLRLSSALQLPLSYFRIQASFCFESSLFSQLQVQLRPVHSTRIEEVQIHRESSRGTISPT
jgi:hypothetical protein